MEINADLLSKILTGDSSNKVSILNWHTEDKIIAPGCNTSSELSRLTVEYQKKGKTFEKSFILKIPSTHPMYNFGLQWSLYEKEFPMYIDVLEEMYKMDGEHIGAKLYHIDDKHSLIMKDLSASGFKMSDRTKQLDFHQCYAVMKCLAKFHALSVKLDQNSKISSAIKRIPWVDNVQLQEQINVYLKYGCEILAKHLDPELGVNEKLLQIRDDIFDKVYQEVVSDHYTIKVLNHGDCWLGNTLFKYDKYGNVAKVKLIDFQKSSWLPPVFDILGFTISSMRFDVFERYFDILMETYVQTLNKTMAFYQCGLHYSLEELRRDMENLQGTVILNMFHHLSKILSSEPFHYHRFVKNGGIDVAYFEKFIKNEVYLKVVSQWISYYTEKGLFGWKI